MNFAGYTLPDELKMLQTTVRRFIADEVVPAEAGLDPEAMELPPEQAIRLQEKVKAMGLWCPDAPVELGGAGLNVFARCIIREETAQHRMGGYHPGAGAFGPEIPPIVYEGTRQQIERYVLPAIQKGKRTFFAITEPSGGSDPAGAIQTKAELVGDNWIINGSKIFISGADVADWGIVFARTDREKGRAGISCFFFATDTPGFQWKHVPVIRPWYPTELAFQDCAIPKENLLGEEGGGFRLVNRLLTRTRIPYAAGCVGTAVIAHRMAIAHARERSTFGALLADRQAVQWMLADNEVEIRAGRWLTWEAAWKADRGEDARFDASIAKVYNTEMAGRAVDRSIQVHGGYGIAKELPLERWYRELRIKRIGEGPSEVHRMVIARGILRQRASD